MASLKDTIEKEANVVLPTPEQAAEWDAKNLTETPKGAWNAATNTPNAGATLTSLGDTLIVNVAGTSSVTGVSQAYALGDKLIKTTTGLVRIVGGSVPPDDTVTNEKIVDDAVSVEKIDFITVDPEGNVKFRDQWGFVGMILTALGVLQVHKVEIANLKLGGTEIDPTALINAIVDIATQKSAIQITDDGRVVVRDEAGAIGLELDVNGVLKVFKAIFSYLQIGDETISYDPDWPLAIMDVTTAFIFAVNKFGDMFARSLTAQTITVTDLIVKGNIQGAIRAGLSFVYGFPTYYLLVPSYGQSNSVGGGLNQVITAIQKYDALMPKDGPQTAVGGDYTLVPLVEKFTETQLSATFEKFTELVANQNLLPSASKGFQFIGSAPGQGSTAIAGLSKGTAPYAKLIDHVTQLKAKATAQGKSFSVPFILWTQGENDASAGTTYADYKAMTIQLIADLNTDIQAITGQKNSIPFISFQVNTNYQTDLDRIYRAQLDLSNEQPLFILSHPEYFLKMDISTGALHEMPQDRRFDGAYRALAAKRLLVDGVKFKPVQPTKITRNGNTLLVNYHVPSRPLVLDTVLVPDPGNYGFRVLDSAGNALTLTNIKIVGTDVVSIDCSASPSGGTLTYARGFSGPNFANPDGISVFIRDWGCLRDSQGDTEISDGRALHNWSVVYRLPIL